MRRGWLVYGLLAVAVLGFIPAPTLNAAGAWIIERHLIARWVAGAWHSPRLSLTRDAWASSWSSPGGSGGGGGTNTTWVFLGTNPAGIGGCATPADGDTLSLGVGYCGTMSSVDERTVAFIIPEASTLTDAYWHGYIAGSLGSAETVSHRTRRNHTTDTTGVAFSWNATTVSGAETGLTVAYSAGDRVNGRTVHPTWVTNPTTVHIRVGLRFTVP